MSAVIDTCTLAHASNPVSGHQEETVECLNRFLANASARVGIDEGSDFSTEANNRSRIAQEYMKHLHHGEFGFAFLVKILNEQRLVECSVSVDQSCSKKINQMVSDPTDRVFIKVAVNFDNKLLISHDFSAFPKRYRKSIHKNIGVAVISASEYKV